VKAWQDLITENPSGALTWKNLILF